MGHKNKTTMSTRKRDTDENPPHKIAKVAKPDTTDVFARMDNLESKLNETISIVKGMKQEMDKVSHSLSHPDGAILNITDETRMVVVNSVVSKLENISERMELNCSDIKSFMEDKMDKKFESYKTQVCFNQNSTGKTDRSAAYNSDEMNVSDNENSSSSLNEGR